MYIPAAGSRYRRPETSWTRGLVVVVLVVVVAYGVGRIGAGWDGK
jgi:hypothetical protein